MNPASDDTLGRRRAPPDVRLVDPSLTTRADVRLAGPAVSTWAGAFVATSGWLVGVPLLVVCATLTSVAALVARRGGWAVVACVLGLLAGLGMGGLRWAGLHLSLIHI